MMIEKYFWNEYALENRYNHGKTIEEYFYNLLHPLDQFSDISKKEMEDKQVGLGCIYQYNKGILKVALVHKNSPADKAGIQRGDRIIFYNDKNLENQEKTKKNHRLTTILEYEYASGVSKKIGYIDHNGQKIEKNLKTESIDSDGVFYSNVLKAGDIKVAYLVYNSFKSTSGLLNCFHKFKLEKAQELILDLRYNTGGYLEN
ncbi:MAG: PDZ domain-containing protein, partial [Desulfobacterales bacterium]|nr:PDZ domain-containing protein [Desulfobacterales bacterium]